MVEQYKIIKTWDILDDFFEKKIMGINISVYSYKRSICRCGYFKNKYMEECPKCKNKEFIELESSFRHFNKNIKSIYYFSKKINPKKEEILNVYIKTLFLDTDYTKDELIFTKTNNLICSLGKDEIDINFSNENKEVINIILKEYKYLNEIEKILKVNSSIGNYTNINLKSLHNAFEIKTKYTKLMNDEKIFQYKNIAYYLFNEKDYLMRINGSFLDNMKNNKIDEKYLLSIDNLLKNYGFSFSLFKNTINELKNNKYFGLERDFLEYYFINNILNLTELRNIINDLNDLYIYLIEGKKLKHIELKYIKTDESLMKTFKLSYMKYFNYYLKQNILTNNGKIVENFITDINILCQNNIAINEENLKQKNINFYKNKELLINDYKFNEKNVNLFLDVIEVNPIKALEILKNKKEVSKEKLEEILNLLTKK